MFNFSSLVEPLTGLGEGGNVANEIFCRAGQKDSLPLSLSLSLSLSLFAVKFATIGKLASQISQQEVINKDWERVMCS